MSGRADDAALTLAGATFDRGGVDARQGWYLDFPFAGMTGERSVSAAALAAGKVMFNTVLPGADICAAPRARSYALDALSGLAMDGAGIPASGVLTGELSADELRGSPVVLETASASAPRDARGRALAMKMYVVLNLGKNGVQAAARAAAGLARLVQPSRRLSWREVANWRELHDAAKK